ncbi:MAG: 4-hydroxyphenylacetate 3-monooxygenase, oxygenase component, partial [Caldilineae bacterium]
MSARRGEQVLQRWRDNPAEIWHRGRRVTDVTAEPGFAAAAASIAELYDLQWAEPEVMLFDSPDGGGKVGRSFLIPRTREELLSVGRMMTRWAEHTGGMLGRTPDYLNRAVSAYAGSAPFLAQYDAQFAENARRYHRYLRDNDLCLTHALAHPQANRALSAARQADPFLAARVKEETDAGLVIRGARMLATLPFADEIMVFPSVFLHSPEEDAPYAFAFILPTATPGLKFVCRETVDYGRPPADHPLGARFEEMDAVVLFDDVFVPWEHVFLYRHVEACNRASMATGALAQMAYQVICKSIAKTGFLLGLVSLLAEAIGVEAFQHVQEKTTEIWVNLKVLEALRHAAEAEAAPNEFGVMTPAWPPLDAARNLYPRMYPRMVEIVQQIGAGGLVATPTLADLHGPLRAEVRRYFQSARLEAEERIPLFRLAWDVALSAFGARQVQYERFFFGDPVRLASHTFHTHDRTPYVERVRAFLRRIP